MSFKFTKSNLNFDVYTVDSKPTAPGANNYIAIITSVPMPNWIMSPDKPSGRPRSDGDVWIWYSVSGNTFNALKNNSMMIATIKAWQYVDGAWTDVEAVSCQNGEWIDWWDGELFDNGNQWEKFTGGWSYEGYVSSSYAGSIVDGELQLYGKSGGFVTIGTKNAIDLTGIRYIEVTHKMISRGSSTKSIGIEIDQPKGTYKAYKEFTTAAGETGTERLDVSGYDGKYFVLCYANNEAACKGTVSRIKLIR